MPQETFDLHVDPSDETICLGPLAVRFLITGEHPSGSVAAFELIVPGAARLPAPAHSHDHYEETIYGIDGVLVTNGGADDTPDLLKRATKLCVNWVTWTNVLRSA